MKLRAPKRARDTTRVDLLSWDIFICHASEDKKKLVAPIASALRRFGLRVWYDEFSLSVGDSLSRSIDKGLARSRFGLVVLSPSFFAKDWPDYELRGLTAREMGREKVILPIWHNVTRDDVLTYSPPLADKFAITTSGSTPLEIAVKVIEVVSPHVFEKIHRRLAFLEATRKAPVEITEVEDIPESPIRHERLPEEQLSRIRLIRASLLEVRPLTMKEWVDGFRRDLHPADEILIWEHYAAAFVEVAAFLRLTRARRQKLFLVLAAAMQGAPPEDIREVLKPFAPREWAVILKTIGSATPAIEIARTEGAAVSFSRSKRRMAIQRVDVPGDDHPSPDELPRDLINKLAHRSRSK